MKHYLIQKSNSQVLVEADTNASIKDPVIRESDLYYNVTADRLTSARLAIELHKRKARIKSSYINVQGTIEERRHREQFMDWAQLGYPELPYETDDCYIEEVPL